MRLAGPVGEADEVHLAPPSAPLRGLNRGHEVEEGDDGEDAAAGQLGRLDSFMLSESFRRPGTTGLGRHGLKEVLIRLGLV